jgi:hypothetical protein
MGEGAPENAVSHGFKTGPGGVHDSRTMMLADLRTLLEVCPPSAGLDQYRSAVIDDNVLHKGSYAGRTGTFRRLLRLYAFDGEVLLFRALRDLWDDDPSAQPLLALLCTVARDPTFRGSAEFILATEPGENVTSAAISQAIGEALPDRYNENILGKIGRNAGSSWTQSGHLQGRVHKVRARAESRPANLAYALLLGHLCGARGEALFHTLWARLVDVPDAVLREQAVSASRSGWIDYRYAGGVTDVGFSYLLRKSEEEGRS